jgi:excisionase family DNA binding protein
MSDDDRLLDVKAVAERLSVPVSWVYAHAEAGRLPSFRIGRYRRFSAREIDQWLAKQRDGGRSRVD